jgi:hypothetical protein
MVTGVASIHHRRRWVEAPARWLSS